MTRFFCQLSDNRHGKGQADMLQMLSEIGVFFEEEFPAEFKSGTFLRRVTAERELTPEEVARIPEAHRPSGPVIRSSVEEMLLPRFVDVMNRAEVAFDGATPIHRNLPPPNGDVRG